VWQWVAPGAHVKRWLLLLLLAVALAGLGIGLLLADAYKSQDLRFPWPVWYLTLQFLDRGPRGLLLLALGLALVALAFLGLNRSLIGLLVPEYRGNVAHLMRARRLLARGPRVTCVGGGTGMSTLLRGLKEHTSNLAAIVTVADEGASSGLLRRALAVPPAGDARQCIAALADAEPLVAELLEYRFDARAPGLEGHSLGNLLLAAMTELTGSFERALAETSRVLAARGRILPATLRDVRLFGETAAGERLVGEALIDHHRGAPLRRVWLAPERPPAFQEALRAILDADLVVVGPGSLYTSLLPNLLIPEVVAALGACRAPRVYVCNVASEPGATDGYGVADHLAAIERHVGRRLFDAVVVHEGPAPPLRPEWGVSRPPVERRAIEGMGYRVLSAPLVSAERPTRHDPQLLARALLHALPTLAKGERGELPRAVAPAELATH
jgi:uncharacterized cofD-like protein